MKAAIYKRARLFTMATVLVCLGGLYSGRAWADTAPGSYTHCYTNLLGEASQEQMYEWSNFVASIRNAAAHYSGNNGVMETQSTGGAGNVGGGLIEATISYAGATLTLWISPRDLYLRGITNTYGDTYEFSDNYNSDPTQSYSLYSAIYYNHATGVQNLNFGRGMLSLNVQGNYNSLAAANSYTSPDGTTITRGRETLNYSYGNFTDAFFNLAYLTLADTTGDRAHMARSLMFMIQMTSEAARFNDVWGFARGIMAGNGQVGLPLFQQYLENDWNRISNYGWNQLNGINYSQTFEGINPDTGNNTLYGLGNPYTMYSFADVQRFIAVGLNRTRVTDPALGGLNGNWNSAQM